MIVTLYSAVPVSLVDDVGAEKACHEQVPHWRYHKKYGSETDFFYAAVMDIVLDSGEVISPCAATREQRATATRWRTIMRPDRNIPRAFEVGEQIEFETTITFDRAAIHGDNVNYYGQTHRYILGEGFTSNNQDTFVGPININDDFAALGGDTTLPALSATGGEQGRLAFMQHTPNIGPNHIEAFLKGRRLFHTDFSSGEHVEEFLPGPQAIGGNLPYREMAGKTTNPIKNSCTECHTLNGVGDKQIGQDVTPPKLIGLGLLEAIPKSQLLAWSNANGGRINYVEFEGEQRVGRFGWRAETISVEHQVAKALSVDMGVGSTFPDFGPPEIDEAALEQLTVYSSLLAVPVTRKNITHLPGHQIFINIGCASCHKIKAETGYSQFPELRYQVIHPYTDLLLHDLGEGEYRTAPLWGIGLGAVVKASAANDELYPLMHLMHDGESKTIEQAVDRHKGNANVAREKYFSLSNEERAALQEYLMAL